LPQLHPFRVGEAGPDPADSLEAVRRGIVGRSQDGPDAEPGPLPTAAEVSDQAEIHCVGQLALVAPLQLDPIEVPRAGGVRRVRPLGHDAFESTCDGGLEDYPEPRHIVGLLHLGRLDYRVFPDARYELRPAFALLPRW